MIPVNKSNTWWIRGILFSLVLFSCSYFNTISKSKNGAVRLKIVETLTIDDPEIIHNPSYSFYFFENMIYAVNHSSLIIFAFDEFGIKKFHIGGYGKSPGQFISINDIVQLSNHHFIVIDAVTQKITEFDLTGVFQKTLIDFSYKIKDTMRPPPLKIDDFVIAPNPNAHIIGDSIIYIRGSEQSLYNHNLRTKKSLYGKFSFPDFAAISKGGHYTKIYNNNGFEILENNSSIITNNAFYFIEEATPVIVHHPMIPDTNFFHNVEYSHKNNTLGVLPREIENIFFLV